MKPLALLSLLVLVACSHQREFMGVTETAQTYYGKLNGRQKEVFAAGHAYGANDTLQRMMDASDRLMKYNSPGYSQASSRLKTKTIAVPIQSYVDQDGVVRDGGYRYVKINTVE